MFVGKSLHNDRFIVSDLIKSDKFKAHLPSYKRKNTYILGR